MRRRIALASAAVLLIAAFFSIVTHAQEQKPAPPPLQYASFGDFKLQSGQTIHNFRLAYRTAGTLNAAKSNTILWPTWLGGKSEDLAGYVGPANVADTSKYFVVTIDAIGNGVSSSPSNSKEQSRLAFPEFTIRDMVEAEHRLATETLHVAHVHAVMGISMGGMQTFEWLIAYPDFMDVAIPMAGSPQSTSYDKLEWTTQIDALEADPEWKDGKGTKPMIAGYRVFSEIGSLQITSPAYRVAMTPTGDFAAFLTKTTSEHAGNALNACDDIRQRQAIMSLNLPAEFGAASIADVAKRTHAKLFVVVSPEDHMVNPEPAIAFADAIGAPILRLDTSCGHLALDCVSIGPIVAGVLDDPSSAKSQTLTGTPK
jgi:homoserine O-acetyltransferase/O-succinyltransferase